MPLPWDSCIFGAVPATSILMNDLQRRKSRNIAYWTPLRWFWMGAGARQKSEGRPCRGSVTQDLAKFSRDGAAGWRWGGRRMLSWVVRGYELPHFWSFAILANHLDDQVTWYDLSLSFWSFAIRLSFRMPGNSQGWCRPREILGNPSLRYSTKDPLAGNS